jgi:pantoate--beta-alanine ligase
VTTTLVRADTRAALHRARAGASAGRAEPRALGFVPTMGALHEGHRALMRRAREEVGADGAVVVSIFVNPTQFGPGEDLERYPRTLDADLEACVAEGVDVVFTPTVEEMYPAGVRTEPTSAVVTVDPGPLGAVLEGTSRPGHFTGVLTVVAKLFGLVRPDVAVFGQKDYQQLVLVDRMADDLCMGVEVVGAETVREPSGLALSSRNAYLDAAERQAAATLVLALRAGVAAAPGGPQSVLDAATGVLRGERGVRVDYLELRAPDLGDPPARGEARLLVAAYVGSTRLIDNVAVNLGAVGD